MKALICGGPSILYATPFRASCGHGRPARGIHRPARAGQQSSLSRRM